MTFQKSQTICHLAWGNVAGCSQFYLEIYLEIFFLFPCSSQKPLESHFLEEKTINILLITYFWFVNMTIFPRCRHRYAWYISVHMYFCASSDRIEYGHGTNCFSGWAQETVKIYCTKSFVEMLPFYSDVFLLVHIVFARFASLLLWRLMYPTVHCFVCGLHYWKKRNGGSWNSVEYSNRCTCIIWPWITVIF